MKWIIKTQYIHDFSPSREWQENFVLSELGVHLYKRDFDMTYGTNLITNENGINFELKITSKDSHEVFDFEISTTNWKPFLNKEYPQVVILIEDYFKMANRYWYYLETLTEKEINAIQQLGRTITPFQIKQRIKETKITTDLIKPAIESMEEGKYISACQTNIFSGTQKEHGDILDFWISCLVWIDVGEMVFNDLYYYKKAMCFDAECGSCIPINIEEMQKPIDDIKGVIPDFEISSVKSCLLMKKDWNDTILLFDCGNYYIIHNWWTTD